MSGVVCVVCPFADDGKLKNIHVDLALLVWGPALLSTHASLPPKPIPFPFYLFFPLFFPSPPFSLIFLLLFPPFFVCVRVRVPRMYVRAYLAIPCVSADDNVKNTKSNIRYDNTINKNETNVKYIRIHVYEYTEQMFATNLSHRDRKLKYISKFWTKHGGDGKRWPLTPFPFLAPWPSRPPAIETPPRPVPAGLLISWPKNASCSRIPPRASYASLPPRRWAMSRHRFSLRPCTAPLSCSLQPILKLSLFSLRPSLLQFVSIFSPLLNHGNPIFEPVYVFYSLLFW